MPYCRFRTLPTLEPSLNAHTRIEAGELDIREVVTQGPLVVAALLYSQVSCHHGRRGRRIRLSGEAYVERRLRASVEVRKEGRPSILDRPIGRRGLSAAPPCSQAPSSMSGECLKLCVGGRSEILTATAHKSGHSSAIIRSDSPVDTSQLLAGSRRGEPTPPARY
jgi:hypothetical protein